jgi:hypothetical protein
LSPAPAHAKAERHESLRVNAICNRENVKDKTLQRESEIRPVGFTMSPQIDRDHSEIRQIQVPDQFAPGVARARATPSVER